MKKKLVLLFATFIVSIFIARSVAAQAVTVKGSFDPGSANPQSGSDFTVKVRVNPSSATTIQLYELKLSFDKSKLQVKSISYTEGQRSDTLHGDGDVTLSTVNSNGQIRLNGEITNPAGVLLSANTDRELAQITFTALSASQSIVTIDSSSSRLTRVGLPPDYPLDYVSVSDATLPVNGGTTPVVAATTQKLRIAESRLDLDREDKFTELAYTYDLLEPPFATYALRSSTPGIKQIWVKFIGTSNSGQPVDEIRGPFPITVLGSDPDISSISCNLALTGSGVNFEIKGANFGQTKGTKGTVKAGGTALKIDKWSDGAISAFLNQQAVDGQSFSIVLTRNDEQFTEEKICTIGVSQIQLGANIFCRQPSTRGASNVETILAEGQDGGKVVNQTVSIDRDGIIKDLKSIQEGKGYKLGIKAPKSLRRVVEFIAAKGTTEIGPLSLPVGDIFPVVGGDGKINSADYSELVRQWIIIEPASDRSGDFNGDSRINSFDWACMRPYINAPPDEPKPTAGPLTTISQSP